MYNGSLPPVSVMSFLQKNPPPTLGDGGFFVSRGDGEGPLPQAKTTAPAALYRSPPRPDGARIQCARGSSLGACWREVSRQNRSPSPKIAARRRPAPLVAAARLWAAAAATQRRLGRLPAPLFTAWTQRQHPGFFSVSHFAAEVVMFDSYIVVYKFIQDLHFFITGEDEENELILASVLQGFSDAGGLVLRDNVNKGIALAKLDLTFLCLDEVVDGGIVLETDANVRRQ